jgi:hypothetical protein
MQTTIIITALLIVLFLCLYFFMKYLREHYKQTIDNLYEQNADLQERLAVSKRDLFAYMDITRKEALDSYRRGLQDGRAMTEQKPVYAPQNPVKTMDEHIEDKITRKEAEKANKEFQDGINAIMSYTGDETEEQAGR